MSLRQIVALIGFALATSALVKRATIMFPILLDEPLPGITFVGVVVFYLIVFLLVTLVCVAIAFSSLSAFEMENRSRSDRR